MNYSFEAQRASVQCVQEVKYTRQPASAPRVQVPSLYRLAQVQVQRTFFYSKCRAPSELRSKEEGTVSFLQCRTCFRKHESALQNQPMLLCQGDDSDIHSNFRGADQVHRHSYVMLLQRLIFFLHELRSRKFAGYVSLPLKLQGGLLNLAFLALTCRACWVLRSAAFSFLKIADLGQEKGVVSTFSKLTASWARRFDVRVEHVE